MAHITPPASGGGGGSSVDDTAYDATTWDGDTTHAPSKNAVRDKIELLAPKASPALTGTPTAPTAAQGTNTTQLASTAYVQTEVGLLVPKSLVDTKGDLFVGTADNTVARLAVGSDGQVLTADAASAGGMKWAATGLTLTDRGVWAASTAYAVGDIVTYGGCRFLRLGTSFTSGSTFDPANWVPLDKLDADNPGSYGAANAGDQEFDRTSSSLPTGWSWVNQGSRTYSEAKGVGAIVFASAAGSIDMPLIVESLPSGTWTAIGKVNLTVLRGTSNPHGVGLVLRESSSGKLVTFDFMGYDGSNSNVGYVRSWASPTSFTSTLVGPTNTPPAFSGPVYLQIQRNSSTSWDFRVSTDAVNWQTIAAAQNISGSFTSAPDQIGLIGRNEISAGAVSLDWIRFR